MPDELLLTAFTAAAYRGVHVELFASEKSDYFVFQHAALLHAQLLEAGVKIHLYLAPTVPPST